MVDAQRWSGFSLLVGFNDAFFMSLMFFHSGLFVWKSLERKGSGAFVRVCELAATSHFRMTGKPGGNPPG